MAAPAVDHGYAWMILAASFINHFITIGIIWSLGIFYVMTLNHMEHDGRAQVASIYTLNSALCCVSGTVGGLLCKKVGFRVTGMLGGSLAGAGFILSTWVTNVYYLYATIGILSGCGLGFAYVTAISIIGFYFDKYQSIAFGLAASGVGFGTIAIPVITNSLDNCYGWPSTFLIIGGVCLQMVICGALFREPVQKTDPIKSDQQEHSSKLYLSIFCDWSYAIACFHSIFIWFGITVIYLHFPSYIINLGYTESHGASAMSIMGIANLLGRLVFAGLNSLEFIGPESLYIIGFAGAGISVLLVPMLYDYIWMTACGAMFGFFSGTFGPMFPQVLLEMVSPDLLSVAYGYAEIFMAIGTLPAGPISGLLIDYTQYYPSPLYMGGCSLVLGALMMVAPWMWKKNSPLKLCGSCRRSTRATLQTYDRARTSDNLNYTGTMVT